jgi:hypothetical protein
MQQSETGLPTDADPAPPVVERSAASAAAGSIDAAEPVREIGGRVGPEPTRFGDWERNGRCIDF